MNIVNYGLREKYDQYVKFEDRLSEMEKQVDREKLRPIFSDLYRNNIDMGGAPNVDPIVMTGNPTHFSMDKEIVSEFFSESISAEALEFQ